MGLGIVEALGNCYGSHPEARPVACGRGGGGPCRAARINPAVALASYRFAMAFDASADSVHACPRHVGASVVLEALVAGTIPVYRGPMEAYAVLNSSAIIFMQPWMSLAEGLLLLREVIDDGAAAARMAVAAALPFASEVRWFAWDAALQGIPTELGQAFKSLLRPLA